MASAIPLQISAGLLTIAALHFKPVEGAEDRHGAAIVVGHPMTGVKEQNASVYAAFLAEKGFHAVAFDATYQGESTGTPRGLENPVRRAEDIKDVISHLTTLESIDANRIGVLGICASGGYTSYATQGDGRIKALATVSAVCVGEMMRNGSVHAGKAENAQAIEALRQAAAAWRNADAQGNAPITQPAFPVKPEEQTPESDSFYRDASQYYGTSRGNHPRSDQKMPSISYDSMIPYESFRFQHLISPRPLLMIAGDQAQSYHFSQSAVQKAAEPKELITVRGKNHFDLYDDLTITGPKLVEFYGKYL